MNVLARVLSSILDSLGRRIVKLRSLGKSTETGLEATPFGTDANPIAGMVAIFAETSSKGDQVVIGYINKSQLAGPGEHRIYSTDSNGNVKFSIWLKADGTCEIGGSSKHMTRFEELETAFNELKTAFNSHTHSGVQAGAGVTGPATPQSSADISGAKISTVKTL